MTRYSYKTVVCFDLDDTLYKEQDYGKSAYREVAAFISERCAKSEEEIYDTLIFAFNHKMPAFQYVEKELGLDLSVSECLEIYRKHKPSICLSDEIRNTLEKLKSKGIILGLITDGRNVSQRNKIGALGLSVFFKDEDIVISEEFGTEKPCVANYAYFESKYPMASFFYVGDNLHKDFIAPNKRGWTTICMLDDGRNIHKQDFDCEGDYLPQYKIEKFSDILNIVTEKTC